MQVTGVKCNVCKEIIFSRARHDFHYCSCGNTFVDGGFDYLRFGCSNEAGMPKVVTGTISCTVSSTTKELYDDWNKGRNKFGTVKVTDPDYRTFETADQKPTDAVDTIE